MVIIIRGGVGASVGCMGMEFPRKKHYIYKMYKLHGDAARGLRNGEGYLPRGVRGVPPNLLS